MHRRIRLAAAGLAGMTAAVLVPLAAPAAASPQTFVVTNGSTAGPGSFAQAVADANANPGHDTITFAPQVTATAGGVTPITITDPVTVDACRMADVVRHASGAPIVVDAPDVVIQGLGIDGGVHPLDVTADGDRFTFRGGLINLSAGTTRVVGADDVLIGGAAPASCGGRATVFGRTSQGIELVDTIRATVANVTMLTPIGTSITVTRGQGTVLRDNRIEGGVGGHAVAFDGVGSTAAPARLFGGLVTECFRDCVVVQNGSNVAIGAPDVPTVIRRTYNPEHATLRIEGSAGRVRNTYFEFAELAGIVIGAGSHDVVVEDNDIVETISGDGVLITGAASPPTRIAVRRNNVGFTDFAPFTGPVPLAVRPNHGQGVLVDAGAGIRIEGNVIGGNLEGGVRLGGPGLRDVTVAGNRLGSDPTTEQRPVGPFGPVLQPFGVTADGVEGLVIDGNVIAANDGDGVAVDHAGGALVRGNRIGTNAAGTAAAPNGNDGILVVSPDVTIEGNLVAGNLRNGITVDPGAVRVQMRANRVGAPGMLNGQSGVIVLADDAVVAGNLVGPNDDAGIGVAAMASRAQISGNTVIGNHVGIGPGRDALVEGNRLGVRPDGTTDASAANDYGIYVHDDGNVLRRNVVTNTTEPNGALVIEGERNRITEAAMYGNNGHAVDLLDVTPTANGGILPPVPTAATAIVLEDTMRVTGTTPGTTTGTVEVYGNRACGPTDHEAEQFLGRITVTNGSFNGAVLRPLFGATQLTLTVTDGDGDTSELSSCLAYTGTPRKAPKPTTPPPPPPFPPVFPIP